MDAFGSGDFGFYLFRSGRCCVARHTDRAGRDAGRRRNARRSYLQSVPVNLIHESR
jgi:hypothetical protein